MTSTARITTVLVVLGPDSIRVERPLEDALIRRAASLATATNCELELFHVCHNGAADSGLFVSHDERERRRLTDREATRLAELASRLREHGVEATCDVRWDHPRTDAILRKIVEARPDFVMKRAREHSYLLGIATNTDWELARRSPAHIWLVDERVENIGRIVAAVGNKSGGPGDITSSADYKLLRTATMVGAVFEADVHPVNAYQLPSTQGFLTAVGPMGVAPVPDTRRLREQAVKQHGAAIMALARNFEIPRDHVHISEGHPNDVIPEVADAVDADLLVMGARSIGRLERLVSSVTVEPVMAETHCDMLVLREAEATRLPSAIANPVQGTPKFELERAITHPEDTFESPRQVARLDEVSVDLRERILQGWEFDIRAEMAEENEGGNVADINPNALDEILAARELLASKRRAASDRAKAR